MSLREQIEAASALRKAEPSDFSLTLLARLLINALDAGKLLVIEDEAETVQVLSQVYDAARWDIARDAAITAALAALKGE